MIPAIRGTPVTQAFGNHLQNDCTGNLPDWSNVQDEQIPDSLQVDQNTQQGSGAVRRVGTRVKGHSKWTFLLLITLYTLRD